MPSERPLAGVSYAAGTPIGDAVVAAIVDGNSTDISFPAGFYAWAAFALDTSANYSQSVTVPFVNGSSHTWCPATNAHAERGIYHVASTDSGTGGVLVHSPTDTVDRRLPSDPLPAFGVDFAITAADLAPGQAHTLRAVAYDNASPTRNEYRGPIETFFASSSSLATIAQIAPTGQKIGVGATAVMGFNPNAWPGFEVAVDTDASPLLELYGSGATLNGSTVSAAMPNTGWFRMHVRPVVAGCSCAAYIRWNASIAITNSHLRGPASGGQRKSHGLQTYSGDVVLDSNLIEARGGQAGTSFAVDFVYGGTAGVGSITNNHLIAATGLVLDRDPLALPLVQGNLIDGWNDPDAATNGYIAGVQCLGGLDLIFRNNVVRPNRPFTANYGTAGFLKSGSCAGLIENNVIEGGRGASSSVAIGLKDGSSNGTPMLIINNLLSAGAGSSAQTVIGGYTLNSTSGASPTIIIAHNTILTGVAVALSSPTRVAIALDPTSNPAHGPRIHNNLFFAPPSIVWSVYGGPQPIEALQNNLFVSANWGSGNTLATFEADMCATKQIRTTANAESTLTANQIFLSPGGDTVSGKDGNIETLSDNDWRILPSVAAALAVGIDTSQDICAGAEGTANACVGPGTGACGHITKDRLGTARPTVPTVGAYEP